MNAINLILDIFGQAETDEAIEDDCNGTGHLEIKLNNDIMVSEMEGQIEARKRCKLLEIWRCDK